MQQFLRIFREIGYNADILIAKSFARKKIIIIDAT